MAQMVSLLYNVVDRIYLGHLGDANSMALTGVGLTFPIVSLIMAFTALFGNGGVPLFAMARGRDDKKEASHIIAFPAFWFHVFTDDVQMLEAGGKALQVYFFGFIFMALQFAGQSTFQAVGDAKHSIFFSTLRKVIIVVPLTILLPRLGFGVMGVFLAEPISNVIGGTACYTTMWRTVYRRLGKEEQ